MHELGVYSLKFTRTWERHGEDHGTLIVMRSPENVLLGFAGIYGADDVLLTMDHAEADRLGTALAELRATGGRMPDPSDKRSPHISWDTSADGEAGMIVSIRFVSRGEPYETGLNLCITRKTDGCDVIDATFHDWGVRDLVRALTTNRP